MSFTVSYRDPGIWLDLQPAIEAEIESLRDNLEAGRWAKGQGREHVARIRGLRWVLELAAEARAQRDALIDGE